MRSDLLIVGSGALATLFAFRLAAAGINVTMLGNWQEGLAALRKGGAQLEGRGSQPVRVASDPSECHGIKYALVLVKSWQTEHAALQLRDCLPEDGLAVTLQNGLGNDVILKNIIGSQCVSRGVTTLGATLLAPGFVRAGGDGLVTLEDNPRLSEFNEILRVANFEAYVVENADPAVWGKLLINAAINPISALLRLKNGEILLNHSARALMGELSREAASVAAVLGIALPFQNPESAVEEVAKRTAENLSSMLQDVLRGNPTEVDAINGAIVQFGKLNGVLTPVNRVICSLIKALPVHGKILSGPPVGGV